MPAPSRFLAVFMDYLDQQRCLFGTEAVLLCMEKFEALREACQKICNLLGDRLIIQPLKNLWCDLTTLRVLVNLFCGGGSLLDEGNPLAWSEIPAHLVQCPESIPLPTKQLQLKALWRQRWTQIAAGELNQGMYILYSIIDSSEKMQKPSWSHWQNIYLICTSWCV